MKNVYLTLLAFLALTSISCQNLEDGIVGQWHGNPLRSWQELIFFSDGTVLIKAQFGGVFQSRTDQFQGTYEFTRRNRIKLEIQGEDSTMFFLNREHDISLEDDILCITNPEGIYTLEMGCFSRGEWHVPFPRE